MNNNTNRYFGWKVNTKNYTTIGKYFPYAFMDEDDVVCLITFSETILNAHVKEKLIESFKQDIKDRVWQEMTREELVAHIIHYWKDA